MKVLHTADWHLGDRLRQIDRSADLHGALDQVACYCEQHSVDVLVVAGDMFSELARPDEIQRSLAFMSERFRPLLLSGMTVLAVAGNHDNDIYCELLRRAFQLAAPISRSGHGPLPNGRVYLANRPCRFQLADRAGIVSAQWVCMPYPNAARYLDGRRGGTYASFRHRNQLLASAFLDRLRNLSNKLDAGLPAVLVAHVQVLGHDATPARRVAAHADVVVDASAFQYPWAYVALGHLHRPQVIDRQPHIRYAGSIDRLSLGEQHDRKGVLLFELAPDGLRGPPTALPLESTPFYDVRIQNPRREMPHLTTRFPDAARALVRCHVRYRRDDDNLFEILAELSRIFPRCYERTWASAKPASDAWRGWNVSRTRRDAPRQGLESAESATGTSPSSAPIELSTSLNDTVMQYLKHRLADDADREEMLVMAGRLLEQLE